MDVTDYLRTLRRRWRHVVVAALLGLGAAGGVTAVATPQYEARTKLFVSTQGGADTSALLQGSSFTQQRVKSYVEVVTSPAVLGPVIDQLGLDVTPSELADRVAASTPLDTVIIEVSVRDASPAESARIANALALRFVTTVSELEQPQGDGTSPVRVSVIRPAVAPDAPVSPRILVGLSLGLLTGMALGVATALLREALDTTVTSSEALSALGVSVLGSTVDTPGTGSRPALVDRDIRTPNAEALRQVRTNLQFADVDDPPQVVLVTSAMPGEGKTATTTNLALTMAMAGLRVILVEADLRLPRVADYLGLEGGAGLTTVLAGRADLDDVLQPYGDTGLHVLTSGSVPPNPSELLGSGQMAALVAALRERADVVLLDSPPLLPVTDAAVLSRHADGAIVVARHRRTTRDQLGRALDRLRSVDARVLGAVLSMVPSRGPEGAYGYGYGYGPDPQAAPGEPSAGTWPAPRRRWPAHGGRRATTMSSTAPASRLAARR